MRKENIKDHNLEQSEVRRLKSVFLPNVPNKCNVQVNRKIFQTPLKAGDVLEITPAITQSASSQLAGSSASNANLSSSFGANMATNMQNDDHSSPILLQVVEESFKDDVPSETIRIDAAAGTEPFNFNKMSYVLVKRVKTEVW